MQLVYPAHPKWALSIVSFTRIDSTLHFCVDYGELNAVVLQDTYRTPCMDMWTNLAGHATKFFDAVGE